MRYVILQCILSVSTGTNVLLVTLSNQHEFWGISTSTIFKALTSFFFSFSELWETCGFLTLEYGNNDFSFAPGTTRKKPGFPYLLFSKPLRPLWSRQLWSVKRWKPAVLGNRNDWGTRLPVRMQQREREHKQESIRASALLYTKCSLLPS